MPGRNRTGPVGYGPLTGRGMGFCAGPGGLRRGTVCTTRPWPYGGGMRRGWRHQYHATGLFGWEREGTGWGESSPYPRGASTDELGGLKAYASTLEEELSHIKSRIRTLQETSGSSSESD
jgi:hypothetical protein